MKELSGYNMKTRHSSPNIYAVNMIFISLMQQDRRMLCTGTCCSLHVSNEARDGLPEQKKAFAAIVKLLVWIHADQLLCSVVLSWRNEAVQLWMSTSRGKILTVTVFSTQSVNTNGYTIQKQSIRYFLLLLDRHTKLLKAHLPHPISNLWEATPVPTKAHLCTHTNGSATYVKLPRQFEAQVVWYMHIHPQGCGITSAPYRIMDLRIGTRHQLVGEGRGGCWYIVCTCNMAESA